jgi:hypothetical protein
MMSSEYEVSCILDTRWNVKLLCREYKVQWKNYSLAQSTWERIENLTNCHQHLKRFALKNNYDYKELYKNVKHLSIINNNAISLTTLGGTAAVAVTANTTILSNSNKQKPKSSCPANSGPNVPSRNISSAAAYITPYSHHNTAISSILRSWTPEIILNTFIPTLQREFALISQSSCYLCKHPIKNNQARCNSCKNIYHSNSTCWGVQETCFKHYCYQCVKSLPPHYTGPTRPLRFSCLFCCRSYCSLEAHINVSIAALHNSANNQFELYQPHSIDSNSSLITNILCIHCLNRAIEHYQLRNKLYLPNNINYNNQPTSSSNNNTNNNTSETNKRKSSHSKLNKKQTTKRVKSVLQYAEEGEIEFELDSAIVSTSQLICNAQQLLRRRIAANRNIAEKLKQQHLLNRSNNISINDTNNSREYVQQAITGESSLIFPTQIQLRSNAQLPVLLGQFLASDDRRLRKHVDIATVVPVIKKGTKNGAELSGELSRLGEIVKNAMNGVRRNEFDSQAWLILSDNLNILRHQQQQQQQA